MVGFQFAHLFFLLAVAISSFDQACASLDSETSLTRILSVRSKTHLQRAKDEVQCEFELRGGQLPLSCYRVVRGERLANVHTELRSLDDTCRRVVQNWSGLPELSSIHGLSALSQVCLATATQRIREIRYKLVVKSPSEAFSARLLEDRLLNEAAMRIRQVRNRSRREPIQNQAQNRIKGADQSLPLRSP